MRTCILLAGLLAGDVGRTGRAFDPEHCKLLQRIPLGKGTGYALAFSPDGRHLAVGCDEGVTFVLAARSWEVRHRLQGHTGGVYGVAFSPDGRLVGSAGARDEAIRLWTVETGESAGTIKTDKGVLYRMAFQPAGDVVLGACQGESAVAWALGGGPRRGALPGHREFSYACCFRADGRRAATSDSRGTLRVWRTDTWELVREIPGRGGTVYALSFSRDGRGLLSGGREGHLALWDVESGRELLTFRGHTGEVRGAVFTPDGRHVISAADTTVRIWDAARGTELRSLPREDDGMAFELAVHPSGTWFALTGSDGAVHIYGRD
jgi:WD40 repeat protein